MPSLLVLRGDQQEPLTTPATLVIPTAEVHRALSAARAPRGRGVEPARLEFDIDPTERSMEVRDSREQRAEARNVHNVLHPRSVAVIGASTDPTKIGHLVLLHLLHGNFAGPVYPVNPARDPGSRTASVHCG